MISRLENLPLSAWAGIVLVVGLLLRLGLWLAYQPVAYSDTNSYRRLAASILGGWARYDGTRTPGYPLFLAALGPDEQVWLAQMALGLGTTLLLFGMGWLLSKKAWFAGLAGLAHTLNLGQLFFEANLITETLATFAVIAALAGTFLWLTRPARRGYLLAIGISLSASFAWVVRPLFVFLPFWLLLFLVVDFQDRTPSGAVSAHRLRELVQRASIAWGIAAAYLIPAVLILTVWVSYINNRYHITGLSVMTGYHLMQHTGNYFELLPDEEAALRDTYLKYRQAQIEEHGTQANTIWDAIPEMQEVSGLSFYALSRKLNGLSTGLILAHPDLYLQYAAWGWWLFWRAPVYWSEAALVWQGLEPGLSLLITLERVALFVSNLLFVVTSLAAVASRSARRVWALRAPLWCLAGTVWITSIVQTLVDHGDNPRFLVPLQSLAVLWVMWIIWKSIQTWAARSRA